MRAVPAALGVGIVVAAAAGGAVALMRGDPSALPAGTIVFASYDRGSDEDRHGGAIRIWRAGATRTVYEAPDGEIVLAGPVWLSGGRLAFLHGVECQSCPAPEVVVLDGRGTELERFTVAEARGARMLASSFRRRPPAVSPDGRWQAFAYGASIRVVPTAGGAARTLARCPTMCGDPAWQAS